MVDVPEALIHPNEELQSNFPVPIENVWLGRACPKNLPTKESSRPFACSSLVTAFLDSCIRFVGGDHFVSRAGLADGGGINPDDAVAEASNLIELVGDKDDGAAGAGHVAHLPKAFLLETDIADGKNFVHEKDFRLEMGGDSEGQADVHAGRIVLHGRINEFFEFGKGHDFVELADDLGFAHAQDGAGEEGVFAAGKLGMKAGAHFKERADAAMNLRPAGGGASDSGEDFEKSGLTGAVAADEAKHFAFFHFQGNIFQGPEGFFLFSAQRRDGRAEKRFERVAKPVVHLQATMIALAEPFSMNDGIHRLNVPTF